MSRWAFIKRRWGVIRLGLIVMVLTLACGRSMWMAFTSMAIAQAPTRQGHVASDTAVVKRYQAAAGVVRDMGVIGYIGQPNPLAARRYHLARLVLLPAVVVPSGDKAVVLADFPDEQGLTAAIATRRWGVIARFGHGLAVLRAAP